MHTVTIWRPAATVIAILLLLFPGRGVKGAEEYEGYKLVKARPGYDKAQCVIEHVNPTVYQSVSAWVGLDNNDEEDWIWMQTGWVKMGGWADVSMFYEYRDETPYYRQIIYTPPPPGGATYGVRKNGSYAEWIANGIVVEQLPWSLFDREALCGVMFCAEMHGGAADHTPGSVSNPCDFSSAVIREVDGIEASVVFSGQNTKYKVYTLDSAQNGRVLTGGGNAFATWDVRVP